MNIKFEDTRLADDYSPENFLSATPFPLLIIDDFLLKDVADKIFEETLTERRYTKSRDYLFAKNKFESPDFERLGPYSAALKSLFLSQPVADVLSRLLGRQVFIDPGFLGGGLHRGGQNSFLDMHADFALHPSNRSWVRELNILLYLNPDWRPEYGGCLELRNSETEESVVVEPLFNRLVIMLTKDHTLHGYNRISFPSGTFRTSFAMYAYSQSDSVSATAGLSTTTQWVPASSSRLRKFIARVTPQVVMLKQRLFGSSTGRRR